jgi:N-acetylglucosaminyldiphosphoundecaprenol N-acetyl-beta-D-mannosaminyltransferase
MSTTQPATEPIDVTYPLEGAPFPLDRRSTPRVRVGRLNIDTCSREMLLQMMIDHALHGQETHHIVTANAQFYVLAEKDEAFRTCLQKAEHSCADGMPLVWACHRLAGTRVPRIAGVDLIEDLCRVGATRGLRIFLLGGTPGAGQSTAAVLAKRYPGIEIAGVSCPPYRFEERPETLFPVLAEIAAARPHIVFVAIGAPRQELFIDRHVRGLRVPIAIGIGGSFEIICGTLQRAPVWMQTSGLEWLYRLRQEPRRLWKRYLVGNTEFLIGLAKWKLAEMRPQRAVSVPFGRQ